MIFHSTFRKIEVLKRYKMSKSLIFSYSLMITYIFSVNNIKDQFLTIIDIRKKKICLKYFFISFLKKN